MEYAEPLLDKITDEINNNIKPNLALNLGDLVEDFNDERFTSYEPKVDKMSLKQALKDGEEIPGATLVERQNIQIK